MTPRFWSAYRDLPGDIKERARAAYRRFEENPAHPGLRFKKVHPTDPIYSARVTQDYRAVAVVRDDLVVWFFIGNHADYEKLLRSL